MKNIKSTKYIVAGILFFSFLVEYPLWSIIASFLPILTILPKVIFYIAIFTCMIFVEKILDKVNVLKTILITALIFVVLTILPLFNSNIQIALITSIINPIIIASILLFGLAWILKYKIKLNKWFLIFGSSAILSNIIFNILEYNRIEMFFENSGSYVQLLTLSTSLYNIIAGLSFYLLIYLVFFTSINAVNSQLSE